MALLEKTEAGKRPVRLLGASLHNLVEEGDGEGEAPAPEAVPQLDLPVE